MNKELTRHDIRRLAFQALFMLNSNVDADELAIYRELIDEINPDLPTPSYLKELVAGVKENQSAIDETIVKYLKNNWSISRLSKTDLMILRLAVYEMLYVEDLPNKVALDEALQLASDFSDPKSRAFINGVLDNLI